MRNETNTLAGSFRFRIGTWADARQLTGPVF